MDEQFDERLKNHIREAFEDFEDHSVNESWLLLREKFPAKKKDRGLIWLWLGSAAAVLLLALGLGTWFNLNKDEHKKLSYKNNKHYQHSNKPANNQQASPLPGQAILDSANQNLAVNNTLKKPSQTNPDITIGKAKKHNDLTIAKAKPVKDNIETKPVIDNYMAANTTDTKPDNGPVVANNNKPLTSTTLNDTISKNNNVAVSMAPTTQPNSLSYTPAASTKEQQFAKVLKPDNDTRKIQLSVYAATYVNYANGSSGQLNIGAGITSDIRITKNLKFSTGAVITQNSLNYAYQSPLNQIVRIGLLAAPSSMAQSNAVASYSTTSYSIPTLKNYNAQLVALDIPLSLKYDFNAQKNNSYVTLGISSGTFVNEAYNSQYKYVNAIANTTTTQTQTTTHSFGNFYFAKTVDVSFGFGYLLGRNHVIFEPFFKYPLQGLGAQQIRFGAGGLNLKFDFIKLKNN